VGPLELVYKAKKHLHLVLFVENFVEVGSVELAWLYGALLLA
jgi:hypothetical protein